MNNIVIADSHNLCREALCSYIRHADHNVSVEGVGDYASLQNLMVSGKMDLILVDCHLPGWENNRPGDVKVAMIVSMADEKWMMDPSLHGVFPKSISCKAFLGGIHEILAGRTFFPSTGESFIGDFMPAVKKPPQDFGLTGREKEVLSYLVKGQSNKDIARALNLQVVTVKLHVRGICRKMKVANRTQAALTAKENGWG